MNRSLGIVVYLGLLVSTAFGQQPNGEDHLPTSPEGKAWNLSWHDEFDGSVLDESKWETPPDGKRRDAWWMKDAVSLDGRGHLVMRTFKEGDRYIDGCVRTRGKFEHAFGYYVARVKLQKLPGHWSAFWLYNNSVGTIGDEGGMAPRSTSWRSPGSTIGSTMRFTGTATGRITGPRGRSPVYQT